MKIISTRETTKIMDYQKILDKLDRMRDESEAEYTGSNESELDFKEKTARWIESIFKSDFTKIVKYTENRTFNVGQALKDGWGMDWQGEEAIIGTKLQDRKEGNHKVTVENVDWYAGTMRVHFKEGGWLFFDHAVEQFKCVG